MISSCQRTTSGPAFESESMESMEPHAVGNLSPSIALQEEHQFKEWMTEHGKVYSSAEYHRRLQIFVENKRSIDEHNAGNHSYTQGLNQFSDMTFEEFKRCYLMTEPQDLCTEELQGAKPEKEQQALNGEPNLEEQ